MSRRRRLERLSKVFKDNKPDRLTINQTAFRFLKDKEIGEDILNHFEVTPDVNDYELTAVDLSQSVTINRSRIRQLSNELERERLALKIGNIWMYKKEAIDYISNRPNRRLVRR